MPKLTGHDVKMYPKKGVINFLKNHHQDNSFIDKDTKMASMGSCFAIEIAKWLINDGYNYLRTESNSTKRRVSSADWSTIYNTRCLKQIFDYTFYDFNPIVRWWGCDNVMRDPYRKSIKYKKGTEEKKFEQHKTASYNALVEAEVLILTLGLTEIWKDARDGSVFWRIPPIDKFNKKIHKFHNMTVKEIIDDLDGIKKILDNHNPTCKLILSVSPVPLLATFRKDVDVVTANCESKSKLRTAIGEFMKTDSEILYFPSFEYLIFGEENPYKSDYRHVSKEYVNKMMKMFKSMFCL